jgi:hypothetical protein
VAGKEAGEKRIVVAWQDGNVGGGGGGGGRRGAGRPPKEGAG